jgi:hypothetical protein
VLDDVERRRFLVDPAGEHPLPFLVGALDVDLHEGAGQLLFLPRGGRLAGAQANHQILPARGLARVQRDVLHDAVALVEDGEDRDTLRHRGHSALPRSGGGDILRDSHRGILLLAAAAARGQRKCNQQRCGKSRHAYSGIHGS